MTPEHAITLIIDELRRAEGLHPGWPMDPIHASAVLNEEAGELAQACLDFYYSDSDKDAMVKEATHAGAMAIRFLIGIDKYYRQSDIKIIT